MNFDKLQAFLDKADIPKTKTKPKTFLGIAKQPHYENVLSNIYAFYFNVNEEHGLKNLFISTFIDIIQEKTKGQAKQFYFDEGFEVRTEVGTGNGRIDLLLSNESSAIIIENKVYHFLGNDLEDYWNSVKKCEDQNKHGIVISLRGIEHINHPHFINITHMEFIERVMTNLEGYRKEASPKYLIFVQDLYQNIHNLSTPDMDKKELEFYFDYQQKINQISTLNDRVNKHILIQVEKAHIPFEKTTKISGKRTKRFRYFKSKKNPQLMITVVIEDLLKPEKEMYIAVELKGKGLVNKEQYRGLFDYETPEYTLLRKDFYKNTSKDWAHFAGSHYHLTDDQIADLSNTIIDLIQADDYLKIFNKLDNFLSEEKNSKEKRIPQPAEQ